MASVAVGLACVWGLSGAGAAWASGPEPESGGLYRRKVMTADGVPLALYRYQPAGGGHLRPPVLLLADLGFTRAVFDHRGFGLAPYLQQQGREVYVLEPRGHGNSGVPKDWHVADIARRDLPAAVAAIHAARGDPKERIDIVAHGFTGALVLAAAAGPLADDIGRVALLSTPALPEVPNRYAEEVLERGGALSSLPLDPAGEKIFELLFAKHGKFSRGRLKALRRSAVCDLSTTAARELLAWMRTGDLPLGDGTTVKARLSSYARPTLSVLPLRDNWVHPEHGSPLRALLPNAPVKVIVISKVDAYEEDYTHLSVLQGDAAPLEVFPLIEAHLADVDAPEVRTASGSER